MGQTVKVSTGGRLVAECLEALGAEVTFGVPGIHALAVWDGLRTSPIRTVGLRTELSAGFAADGYARTSGRPAPLLLSTGPGALISLAALMEAASAHVPVVAIASQIPHDLIGAGRGFLHELRDQKASFAPVVKWAARAESAGEIPELLAESWRRALTPPSGPVCCAASGAKSDAYFARFGYAPFDSTINSTIGWNATWCTFRRLKK